MFDPEAIIEEMKQLQADYKLKIEDLEVQVKKRDTKIQLQEDYISILKETIEDEGKRITELNEKLAQLTTPQMPGPHTDKSYKNMDTTSAAPSAIDNTENGYSLAIIKNDIRDLQ